MENIHTMETYRERTLATRYQPRQQLPENFPSVLKEYAREVLRTQPEDILAWSADYFRELALETDPLQRKQPPADRYAAVVEDEEKEMLRQQVAQSLEAQDETGAGVVSVAVVERVLEDHFGLSPSQALYVLTSPSTPMDDAGAVTIAEFSKASVGAIQFFQASGQDFRLDGEEDVNTTVHGLNRNDVEGDFFRMFRMIDDPQDGLLPFIDYSNALHNAPWQLTRRDLRALCSQCHRSEDDEVNYEVEREHWFDLLRLCEQFELFDAEDSEDQ